MVSESTERWSGQQTDIGSFGINWLDDSDSGLGTPSPPWRQSRANRSLKTSLGESNEVNDGSNLERRMSARGTERKADAGTSLWEVGPVTYQAMSEGRVGFLWMYFNWHIQQGRKFANPCSVLPSSQSSFTKLAVSCEEPKMGRPVNKWRKCLYCKTDSQLCLWTSLSFTSGHVLEGLGNNQRQDSHHWVRTTKFSSLSMVPHAEESSAYQTCRVDRTLDIRVQWVRCHGQGVALNELFPPERHLFCHVINKLMLPVLFQGMESALECYAVQCFY